MSRPWDPNRSLDLATARGQVSKFAIGRLNASLQSASQGHVVVTCAGWPPRLAD